MLRHGLAHGSAVLQAAHPAAAAAELADARVDRLRDQGVQAAARARTPRLPTCVSESH